MIDQLVSEQIVLTRTDDFLAIQNRGSNSSLRLLGKEEFCLEIGKEGSSKLSSSDFRLGKVDQREGSLSLCYSRDGFQVIVSYECHKNIVQKNVRFKSTAPVFLKRVFLETRISDHALSLGGEGLPIFAAGIGWLGIEFPAANNTYDGNAVLCKEAPFLETQDYDCLPVVYGIALDGNVSESFRAYIDETALTKRDDYLKVYCNWGSYDNMTPGDPIFDDALVEKNFRDLDRLEKSSGIGLDYFLQDAFWFSKGSHYLSYDQTKLTKGTGSLLEKVRDRKMKYGLWFDLNFKTDERKDWPDMDAGLGNGALCFNEEKVYQAMEKAILTRIQQDGIKMLKLDFAYFECHNPAHHDHSNEHVESKQKAIQNFIKMVGKIRQLDPEIKILCYNGWTRSLEPLSSSRKPDSLVISPYWTRYVDRLYCGDPRPSEIPTPRFNDSLLYYTDSKIYDFHDSFIPLRCIDDHGSMCGNTGTIYYLGNALFQKSILLNVARGGQKLNPYGDIGMLNGDDIAAYCKAEKMLAKMQEKNMVTHPVVGDPRQEEPYGYLASNGEEGFLSLVNPSCESRLAEVKLKEWKGSDIELTPIYGPKPALSGFDSYRFVLEGNCVQVYSWKRIGKTSRTYEESNITRIPLETKLTMAPGQQMLLDAGEGALSCRFFLDGKPCRSANGYPDGIEIRSEKGDVLPDNRPCQSIWSGLSWLWFPNHRSEKIRINNRSGKTYTIRIAAHPKS